MQAAGDHLNLYWYWDIQNQFLRRVITKPQCYRIAGNFRGVQFSRLIGKPRKLNPRINAYTQVLATKARAIGRGRGHCDCAIDQLVSKQVVYYFSSTPPFLVDVITTDNSLHRVRLTCHFTSFRPHAVRGGANR